MHTATPIVPIILPIILSMIDVKAGSMNAKIEPTITIMLKIIKNLFVTSMPNPPYDQARL